MANLPIPFSAHMVRALLDGRKTQTRRMLQLPHNTSLGTWEATTVGGAGMHTRGGREVPERAAVWHTRTGDCIASPYAPGDYLWVREAWHTDAAHDHLSPAHLPSDAPTYYLDTPAGAVPASVGRYRHARFMPRVRSRLTLIVTDVRVQRLQEISEGDAIAEGLDYVPQSAIDLSTGRWVPGFWCVDGGFSNLPGAYLRAMASLWDCLHGSGAWDANPWVVALTFTVHRCNIDDMEGARDV